jgi:hypothetical protein
MRAFDSADVSGVTRLPKRFVSLPYRFLPVWVLLVAVPLALVLGAIVGSLLDTVIGKTGGTILAAGCGLVIALYAVLVLGRVGVTATADGVLVRGFVRNRHIDWRDIDHFEDENTRTYQAYVVLVSGKRVKLAGLGPSWLLFHGHTLLTARQSVADLNTIRTQELSAERRE